MGSRSGNKIKVTKNINIALLVKVQEYTIEKVASFFYKLPGGGLCQMSENFLAEVVFFQRKEMLMSYVKLCV